jgi:hypothetical protein
MEEVATNGFSYTWAVIAVFVALLVGVAVYITVDRAATRPVKQGFYGGAITGSSNLSCGRMSSEAEKLYALFLKTNANEAEEGSADLRDLKVLLSKLCCFKQDLMAPQQTITASKELKFVTQQDIQPLGDLTGRCFNKTIPERDLSLQFIKWRDAGKKLIHRLCTEGNLSEKQVMVAENLFATLWKDVEDVANNRCLTVLPKEKNDRHDPLPRTTEDVMTLKEYDGLY